MRRFQGLLAVGAVLVTAGVGCSRERVPLPPADATPQEVVRAYIDAVNAADCSSLRALSEPEGFSTLWCRGDVKLTNVRIAEPRPDGCCGVSGSHAESRNVPVVFDRRGGDVSFPDERDAAWGYILVRDETGQRWRVADQGVG